jgi:hypothetical protein
LTFDPNKDVHLQVHNGLLGGKGGFGSMLRAIGAQIEKTTNKEACRDLSGRRLRDVNAEKRIKNWVQKQADKQKEEERRKKEKLERLRSEPKVMFEDRDYMEQRDLIPGKIEDAVSYSMNNKKTVTASSSTSAPSPTSDSSQESAASNDTESVKVPVSTSSHHTSGGDKTSPDTTSALIQKMNLKRKSEPKMVVKASKKKKSTLWLGDDLSDGEDDEAKDLQEEPNAQEVACK